MKHNRTGRTQLEPGDTSDGHGEDIQFMINLLEEKLNVLEENGMLRNIGPARPCTSNEKVFARCKDTSCQKELPPRLSSSNLKSILKPVQRVGLQKIIDAITSFQVNSEGAKYVFLTAASSNHFWESEAAIESLHKHVFPFLENYRFFYYDLGLDEKQRDLVRSYSGAVLRDFPFHSLPKRFANLFCYTWKPLIITAHISSAEVVIWLDSSIRFQKDIRPLLENVVHTGVLVGNNGLHFPQHVHGDMFSYFGDEACQFAEYQEIDANLIFFHNQPFTRKLVLEPLCACALDVNCMCPQKDIQMGCSPRIRQYSKCHRFDQAALGYILIKLLQGDKASFILHKEPFHTVERDNGGTYLEKKKREKEGS